MKKFFVAAIFALTVCLFLPSCKKEVNLTDYISENREGVYYYCDDFTEIKIYRLQRETPYSLDGVRGDVSPCTEIYLTCADTPAAAEITIAGESGEMNYMSVGGYFYLSFGKDVGESAQIDIELTLDGKEKSYAVPNVSDEKTITPQQALKCAEEYDEQTFSALKSGKTFLGEISVRLIYDDGCYYYIGVCDRQKNILAYLVDGTDGRVICKRESTAYTYINDEE